MNDDNEANDANDNGEELNVGLPETERQELERLRRERAAQIQQEIIRLRQENAHDKRYIFTVKSPNNKRRNTVTMP